MHHGTDVPGGEARVSQLNEPNPKRSLGQNFLVDPNLQRKIVAELGPGPESTVLEVGPGHGELSQHLVSRVGRLTMVEKDRALVDQLNARWGTLDRVTIVEGDALQLNLSELMSHSGPVRVISNVPYNITSPLIFSLLAMRPVPERIVLTVQKEVAERVVAVPGQKSYGALSVGVQAVARVSLRFSIGREVFRPRPEVDSAVLLVEPEPQTIVAVSPSALRNVTRACFNRRRKQIQKILRSAPELGFEGDPVSFLSELGISPKQRPESLSPTTFIRLTEALQKL
jgi:16S rRNA (adenine1518-N6/adenine1519-N6)-dimethyltransferase